MSWSGLGRIFAMEGNEYIAKNCYILSYSYSKNKEKAYQYLANGANETTPLVRKALLSAYEEISNNGE